MNMSCDGEEVDRQHLKPMELFKCKKYVKISAPMVRYSKLAFRTLVRKYGCDLAFTPMIISNSFVRSAKARDNEFTTNELDRPLIVQFAANRAEDFADATEIVAPFCDGVDLNCGCPQRWAIQEGIGACLINKPDLVSDIVSQARARIDDPEFCVSIKIRIHDDLKKTVSLCQQIEKTGISWISVHGRTISQRAQPVNYEAIRTIKESVQIPVVANGDIKCLADGDRVHELTGVDGVMSARGILSNPTLYAGYESTPVECIRDWLDITSSIETPFKIFHHHLIDMLKTYLPKAERRIFNTLPDHTSVVDFLTPYLDSSHDETSIDTLCPTL